MIELRDYQANAVQQLRDGISAGRRCQVLCAPTGAGKTIIGAHMLQRVQEKGNRALFLVDRVALTGQTSRTFWDMDIPHGILQGANSTSYSASIMICACSSVISPASTAPPSRRSTALKSCALVKFIGSSVAPQASTADHSQRDGIGRCLERIMVSLCSSLPPLLIALATAGGRTACADRISATFSNELA